MNNMKNSSKSTLSKILNEIDETWTAVPTPVKIIIYVMVASMMSQAAQDVLDLQKDNFYFNAALLAVNNILLWVAVQLTSYISKLKNT